MLRTERDHDRVVRCRCLQLEIERTTKTFSQCETPGAIDSTAERRVQNELHSARFIEETLDHERLLGGKRTERSISIGKVIGDLLSSFCGEPHFRDDPLANVPAVAEQFFDLRANIRNSLRKLGGARGRLPKPKWNSRRLTFRILHANDARVDA